MKNLLNNLPPFYIGEVIEAIKNIKNTSIKKWDKVTVYKIVKCNCGFYINYGLKLDFDLNKSGVNFKCGCGVNLEKDIRDGYLYSKHTNFRSLQKQNFHLIKLKEIKENEESKIEEFEKQILIEN